jgi:large subunit ribosomal protein L30
MTDHKLRITWVKSGIGYSRRQKDTIRALGLRRLGAAVEQADTPVIRGMISKISHLVRVEEIGQVTTGNTPAQSGQIGE